MKLIEMLAKEHCDRALGDKLGFMGNGQDLFEAGFRKAREMAVGVAREAYSMVLLERIEQLGESEVEESVASGSGGAGSGGHVYMRFPEAKSTIDSYTCPTCNKIYPKCSAHFCNFLKRKDEVEG